MLASTHTLTLSAKKAMTLSSQMSRQRELLKSAYHLKYFTPEYFVTILGMMSRKSLMLSSQLARSQRILRCSLLEEANVSQHWRRVRGQEPLSVFIMSLLISLHKLMTASGVACSNESSEKVFFAS